MIFARKNKDWVQTYGSEILKAKSRPVDVVTPELRQLAERMANLLSSLDGIGLAAPQAGENLRLVTLGLTDPRRLNPDSPGELLFLPRLPMAVVNPEIIDYSRETGEAEEGCLSVPGIFAPVERPLRVVFRARTLDGEQLEFECAGLLARLIQHEFDHLDGISFIERLSPPARRDVDRDLRRLLRQGEKSNYRKAVIV